MSDLIEERKKKLHKLREQNINPYPHVFRPTTSAEKIKKKHLGLEAQKITSDKVVVAGRIKLFRKMGKASFLQVQDASGTIQLFVAKDNVTEYDLLDQLDLGDIVGCSGLVMTTKTGEISVRAESIELLAKSIRPLPEKFHGLKDKEARYRKRYLDFIVNPHVKETFEKRALVFKAIRSFLDERGFIEVQTPILQPMYGGGIAKPFKTKINAWDMDMYLRIAYEIYLKKLLVGGFEKIYDLSYCFRNEGSDRTHNPEFSMMEIQWAYADYEDAMRLTEDLWEHVAKLLHGTTKISFQGEEIDLKAPWRRLRVVDALKEYAQIDTEKLSDDELYSIMKKNGIKYSGDINRGIAISLLFEELCEQHLIQPTHIIDHPVEICPLAKAHRDDSRFAERLEPFIYGWEVGNCYTELNDPELQRKHFEEQVRQQQAGDEEAHPMDEDYIEALEHGLPPNCGIGVGVDRMIMLLTNSASIRDVILFPTMRPEDD